TNEICDGIAMVIDNPEVTIEELMTVITGPDFPTGAQICGTSGIKEGYKTGRGTIIVRAKAHVETSKTGRKSIVVTEIPYQLNRDNILERIALLVREELLKGISDVRNESDRHGSRLVIDLKKGEDEEVVLNQLYKHTKLQDTFSIIMIALVDNRPETLNLKQMLICYIEHRKVVIVKRTKFLLEKAQNRAHVLEGLKIALNNIDRVIELIKTSDTVDAARRGLISSFSLSEIQANAILDMRLQRLTGLEQGKIDAEYEKLCADIKEYQSILANEKLVLDIIKKDVAEIKEQFGDKRRTEIVGAVTDLEREDLITEENVTVIISHEGYIKRLPLSAYRKQQRGGKGVIGAEMKEGDFAEHLFVASTHDYILFFTDQGKVYWLKVYDVPQMGKITKGRALINLLELKEGENVTSFIPVRNFDDRQLVMATSHGIIKKTVLSAYGNPKKGGIIAINLDEGDTLIGVKLTNGKQDLILGTEQGKAVRFSEEDVRSVGRVSRGVKGIKLKNGDKVCGMVVVDDESSLMTICENGFGKRTNFEEYSAKNRGGQGVINIKTTERNGKVVGLLGLRDDDELIMITKGGKIIRTPVNTIRIIGRNTQGVKLFDIGKADKLISVARVIPEENPTPDDLETENDIPEQAQEQEEK
ncbi:MAG: DNA gyrase subunit A, partial [Candidatus Kuenenia stuttgartiensis]